ncbi:Kinase-like protein [Mycena indigotica]|uniref:Kinase-like protein n=1 Tax=Mycena indigotica TaxID=2126181 RepID=A0A8H6SWV3_9AGAR|nr:Kinase-like protein [Mycena indigotica]KAF7306758.1 Kinase-like protein [Mycena indigotica]
MDKKYISTNELDKQEKAAFLEWRRGLASLQDEDKFLLTPFERNIEVWRQLWRVLERSHLVVQIVDARNPLRFRCEDLEAYVNDVEGPEGEHGTGEDLLTAAQRCQWADYFDQQGVKYAFFSAANAAALQEARREQLVRQENVMASETEDVDEDWESGDEDSLPNESESDQESHDDAYFSAEEDTPEGQDPRAKVLSVLELEGLFQQTAPPLTGQLPCNFLDASGQPPSKLVVGLVGYPNVGKSSTINSLLGEKKVSVSSTPGKTKHFQTINLSDTITLCDCPGLVFPQFATTKADLVCDGVLPIDQMREHTGPIALVVRRIRKEVLEATYGLSIKVQGLEEGGDGKVTAENFLIAHAIARGYMRSGQGNPDEARSARYILKDYVNAKLLFCHPPPGATEESFNRRTHELAMMRFADKKRAPTTRVGKDADTFVPLANSNQVQRPQGLKSQALDKSFFEENSGVSSRPFVQGGGRGGQTFSRSRIYPHQNAVADDGTALSGRRARIASVLANHGGSSICAKVVISKPLEHGMPTRREAIVLCINKPVKIGRHPHADYVLTSPFTSLHHCTLFAVPSQNGGVIVSCQDYSRNGILLNGYRIVEKSSVILMHGDKLELPDGQGYFCSDMFLMAEAHAVLTCHHIWKDRHEKVDLFDPTPPTVEPAKMKKMANFLISSQKLGSGSFATVHLAFDMSNDSVRQVACKTIRKKKGYDLQQVFKEVTILNGLAHPNINKILATHDDNHEFMFIFLQLCTGGDLFTYITTNIEKNRPLCEAESKFIMYQILLGLEYLHSKNIAHRDLKPENILLHAPGPYPRVVIADFGLARPHSYQSTLNVCGTISYLPPEGIAALNQGHLKYMGMPSDCWSVGVILYIMICGSHPFDHDSSSFGSSLDWNSHIRASHTSCVSDNYYHTEDRLKNRILRGEIEYSPYHWRRVPDAKTLVCSLLTYDYSQRATIQNALDSTWIKSEQKLLDDNYHHRCSVSYARDFD